jgi:8-oxo-dGTP pyrophosphatase MutT (NUDIX family)
MFNPRAAEIILGVKHSPPVPHSRLTPDGLKQRFAYPPAWQPEVLREVPLHGRPAVGASVLIAVVSRPEPTVLLTLRSAQLPVHAGQVAFPGGKWDADDPHAVGAALREAHEEIGLLPEVVDVLGCLPPYVTGTGFCVTPVVGLVPDGVALTPNPGEVERVFEVPLHFLMNPQNHMRQQMVHEGTVRQWYAMPYQHDGTEFYIWGATAGMLRNFYHFLAA